MGRAASIQQEEVWAVIGRLVRAGRTPTHVSIRQLLSSDKQDGSTRGSPVVIQRYLDEWWSTYSGSISQLLDGVPPEQAIATHRMAQQFESFANANMERIQSESKRQQQVLDERQASLDHVEQDLARRERDLEVREQTQRDHITHLGTRLTEAEERVHALQHQLLEAARTGTAALSRADELERELTASRARLQAELQAVRQELADRDGALAAAHEALATLRDHTQQEARAAAENLANVQRARGETQVRLEAALQAFDALQQERAAEQARHRDIEGQLRQQLAAIREEATAATDRLAATEKARNRLDMQLELNAKLLARAQDAKSEVEGKLKEMSSHLATAHAEIGKLAAAVRDAAAARPAVESSVPPAPGAP
ncbi:DNA-binding protein [Luteimonas sp. MHLX1A]|uniref:DNA-binding protein n=1 Tax=Alterluteimonas muca TaxID=2878684 RepID=UPI001E45E44B|nr:DNA-binding protein [Luteimonas sp. MHLX1A]MCD9046878.1 DNA-binding protein [Luteimonas sp. MHLX1A]